jgi:hypothetical protein
VGRIVVGVVLTLSTLFLVAEDACTISFAGRPGAMNLRPEEIEKQ